MDKRIQLLEKKLQGDKRYLNVVVIRRIVNRIDGKLFYVAEYDRERREYIFYKDPIPYEREREQF